MKHYNFKFTWSLNIYNYLAEIAKYAIISLSMDKDKKYFYNLQEFEKFFHTDITIYLQKV